MSTHSPFQLLGTFLSTRSCSVWLRSPFFQHKKSSIFSIVPPTFLGSHEVPEYKITSTVPEPAEMPIIPGSEDGETVQVPEGVPGADIPAGEPAEEPTEEPATE